MHWSFEERARVVLGLARGEIRLTELTTRKGLSAATVRMWVDEFIHAAPEQFDEDMHTTLVGQGLASDSVSSQQSGHIEDVAPLDLLQSLSIYRKAGHVSFFHAHGTSQLWFEGGEIVDACSGALHGAAAVYRIVGHERGHFRVDVTGQPRPRTIEEPVNALIFEAARRLDESQRLRAKAPASDEVLSGAAAALLAPDLPPDELEVATLFGPGATLGEVQERSSLGELETLRSIASLLKSDRLERTGQTRVATIPSVKERAAALRRVALEISQAAVPAIVHEPRPRSRRPLWPFASLGGLLTLVVTIALIRGGTEEPTPTVAKSTRAPSSEAPPLAVAGAPPAGSNGLAHVPTLSGSSTAMPAASADPPVADENPEPAETEPEPEPEPELIIEDDAQPTPHNRGRKRGRKAAPEATPAPVPMPVVEERPPAEEPPPEDAASLLRRARDAYGSGRAREAYRLADRSYRLQSSPKAAEVAVLAACMMKAPNKARSALNKVTLLRRSTMRTICRDQHSVRIKILPQ
ncbi:MAG: DUF4388 domain-containing protein [Myxococcota bacterium]